MSKKSLTHEEIASLLPEEPTDTQYDGSCRTGAAVTSNSQTTERECCVGSPAINDQSVASRLRAVSAELASSCSATWSEMLRTTVEVELSRVDRLAYGEFLLYRDHPTCFASFSSDTSDGPVALDMELAIVFPMIERLLGGDLQVSTSHRRPLTDIEKRLATRIVDRFLDQLQTVWEQTAKFSLVLTSIESEPRRTEPLRSKDSVVCIQLEAAIGTNRGSISLAIPWCIAEIPCTDGRDVDGRQPPSGDQQPNAKVELSAILAKTNMTAADVQSLEVGDIIATENEIDDSLEVVVDGEPRFQARPGSLDGHKAIRIE